MTIENDQLLTLDGDMGETAESYFRRVFEEQLENYRIAFKNTGNPVYVWNSIHLFHPVLLQALAVDGVVAATYPPSLPVWCMDYLMNFAGAIQRLENGIDPRIPRGQPTEYELNDSEKISVLPEILGFTRPGWNAFAHFRSIFEFKWVERHFYSLRDEGVSYTKALQLTAEEYGYEDIRSLRRRLAKRAAVFRDPDETPGEDQTEV